MKTQAPNTKYVAWKSPEELYETSLHWISELKFIKDEQQFLTKLVEEHTLHLISKENYRKSKVIIQELAYKQKMITPLLKKIINHHNELLILVDDLDELVKEKEYKQHHRVLLQEVNVYFNHYKELKRTIFNLIKTIMKENKQKRLLS
ncbi:hypothetical protein D1816_18800 [Aquimarina sp. AD10]|uniref:Uncharacterized protein n=1 Tax=Aquimarina aggregata TaxID=1642818 RepID=A0A162ZSW8_9FLAO|nr:MULTISPECIES: hypothetical protein [Aquimarina]AXT62324.1 hypothetical protein D1816_18800 [Aquimarina sp. AD10]KZS40008.1 hypothetical protein AWE51_10230 [Aquimarina aggregata]RKM90480.1 hypothetical protein D7033_23580 [Aquimarina sp. AD10]